MSWRNEIKLSNWNSHSKDAGIIIGDIDENYIFYYF